MERVGDGEGEGEGRRERGGTLSPLSTADPAGA